MKNDEKPNWLAVANKFEITGKCEAHFNMKDHDGHAWVNSDQGFRFVNPDDGDGWGSVTFSIEKEGVLAVHVPAYQHDVEDPDAEIGWMKHTVRFDLMAYMHADQMTDETEDNDGAEWARWTFYQNAITEFNERRTGRLPIDKPREDKSEAATDSCLRARTYAIDYAGPEATVVGGFLDERGKFFIDFETTHVNRIGGELNRKSVADIYRVMANGAQWGKTENANREFLKLLETALGPVIIAVSYDDTTYSEFDLGKNHTLPSGRVVRLHEITRTPIVDRPFGLQRQSTMLTFHVVSEKKDDWGSQIKLWPGTPDHSFDRRFIDATRQRRVGKSAELAAGYGGRMKHEDYATRLGGIEIAPENLELQLTSRITTSKPGLPEEFTLRTAITSFFDGLASALTGKPVERLIPESNRDGGYDPKKIDFSAITAAMSGGKR